MLTAFGILGIFIGIVIGLSQIGGQMGGDAEQLKGAMGNLIGSLGVSFRTSIWGLILSVVSTILFTNTRSKLDEQIERWVVWLERTMPQTSIHKIAVEQLVQVEQQTKISYQQLQVVTGLGKEIGTSIEKAYGWWRNGRCNKRTQNGYGEGERQWNGTIGSILYRSNEF